ncbi:hypothetical protein DES53_114126 [Roseimicrobium gellanilyticum]|uniref:Uncharacterized protein n=1 Tax=Roseimicrobium gellanilyticum TaxID=748857 RepID=A0A366H5P4_9BACT|nr:hypothetical protein [Roseimicrobium gellanilyticum]RBP37388.1 hypothetical protein DES53_114126 [Roseimicrobium gellanilyticum]
MKMRTTIATLLGTVLLSEAALHAQQEYVPDVPSVAAPVQAGPGHDAVKYTLLKPNDKTSEAVREMDRNPFGRSDVEIQVQNQKGTNEENQVRDVLAKLRVVGVSPGPSGLRVMLGDMVLEAGQIVPQVLPEQTISLRVASISHDAINLVWVEAKPTGLPPRALTIPVDIRPSVRVRLMGQPTAKNQWEKNSQDKNGAPVTRQFPATAQTPAFNENYMVNTENVPKALPVEDESPTSPATLPAALIPAAEKPSSEWDQAMKLLQKLVPAPSQNP